MIPIEFFLIIFGIICLTHIIAIAFQKNKLRYITKIFIVPVLLASYLAGKGNHNIFTVLALIFGWIGDILLIKKKKRNIFKLGIISFLAGHLCYILVFLYCLGFFSGSGWKINFIALLVYIPVMIIGGICIFRLIKPFKEMKPIVIIYMIIIESMSLWGLQVFVLHPGFAGVSIFLGSFLFLISDTMLSYYSFRKIKVPGAVMIMVTYILAQTGIVMGILHLPV